MKETPDGLDIEDYRPDHRKCELEAEGRFKRSKTAEISRLRQAYGEPGRSEASGQNMKVFIHAS
jgi:hypothetical protein